MINFQFSKLDAKNVETLRHLIVEQQKTHATSTISLTAGQDPVSTAHDIFKKSLSDVPVHSFRAMTIERGALCHGVYYVKTEEMPAFYFGEVVAPREMRSRLGSNETGCAGVRVPPRGDLFFLRPGERVYDQRTQGLLYAEPAP